jgi:hypothetical protein
LAARSEGDGIRGLFPEAHPHVSGRLSRPLGSDCLARLIIGDVVMTIDRRRWTVIQFDVWRGRRFFIAREVNGVGLLSSDEQNLRWNAQQQAWMLRHPDEG